MRQPIWMGAPLACVLALTGCFSPSEEALERLEQTRREGDDVLAQVGHLEERFLGNQAKVLLWQELARRHKDVSALACQNQTAHAVAMAAHYDKLERKGRVSKRSRRVLDQGSAEDTVSEAPRQRSHRRRN